MLEHAVQGFGLYQSPSRHLDPVLRELGQSRAGWAAGSQFVYSQHCKSLRGLGVDEERIDAVRYWPAAVCFTDTERHVLAYTDCLVYDHGRVPEELFAVLKDAIGDEAMLELTYITTLYLHHAVMSRALRTEFDDVDDPCCSPRPTAARSPGWRCGSPPSRPSSVDPASGSRTSSCARPFGATAMVPTAPSRRSRGWP